MTHSLTRFQDDFMQALWQAGDTPAPLSVSTVSAHFLPDHETVTHFDPASDPAAQAGFKVYRNTILKGCIDALCANYPSVARLVGTDWFRAAAAVYVRDKPPSEVGLLAYGKHFADFLEHFEGARELPYLADVARLDRYWSESHMAADAALLDPAALTRLAPPELGNTVLRPHPAARWAWFDTQPAYTIWCANREQSALDDALAWVAEGALLTRPDNTVIWRAAGPGLCAFMDACAAARSLAQAAESALLAEPTQDVAQLLSALITAGALSPTTPPQHL